MPNEHESYADLRATPLDLPRIQSSRQSCSFCLGVTGFAGLIILTEAVR
jgi:hypothetical protein